MMGDRPGGAELLALVRLTLEETLLPQLPAGSRFVARDVLAALAVVERELEQGTPGLAEERALLEALYGPAPDADDLTVVGRLRRRLAQEIRAGKHDGDPQVYDSLCRALAARLGLLYPEDLPPPAKGDPT